MNDDVEVTLHRISYDRMVGNNDKRENISIEVRGSDLDDVKIRFSKLMKDVEK